MTPREIATDVANMAAQRIGEEIRKSQDRMWEHPYPMWKFHDAMSRALPPIRWLARLHHRRMAKRAHAMWQAQSDADKCRLAEAMQRTGAA